MVGKLLIITLVIVAITNLKVFISEIKRDFEFHKMNLRLTMMVDELEEEILKLNVNTEEKVEQPKKRRGRPKKEEVK